MKFIATGDFGGDVKVVERLLALSLENDRFIVFTGDLIAMDELRKIGEATARGLKVDVAINYLDIKDRLQKINGIFKKLKVNTKVYGILGNSDLKKAFISLVPNLEFENIHDGMTRVGDYFLVGFGGRPRNVDEIKRPNEMEKAGIFPGRTYGERAEECNAWDEEKAYENLRKILLVTSPRNCILITHYPPYGILDKVEQKNIPWAIASYGEIAKNGNIGSLAFKRISTDFGILLHIFSHVHESKGIERIGNTTYVNLGSLGEDEDVCEVEVKNESVKVNFLKI